MTNFDRYTDSMLAAFIANPHTNDVVKKKYEIVQGIYDFYNYVPDSILFVGFNPAMLYAQKQKIFVTEISQTVRNYVDNSNIKYTYIDYEDLTQYAKSIDVVVAFDEYFTFAESDQAQQDQIGLFCRLSREFLISTLKDYKNQDYKEKEYSQPVLVRNGSNKKTYIESHDWDIKDRSTWKTTVYEIDQTSNELVAFGPFNRRTMYFKQLAKFSSDSGASNFTVHKNLMYKGLVKKNYEHVISITFDGH
jgi:hypothetical protein